MRTRRSRPGTLVAMRTGPRLSAGQALTAWSCQRYAAMLLDPEQARPRSSEGAFRLGNAIAVAILDAHRRHEDTGSNGPNRPNRPSGLTNGLSEALGAGHPPPELGHEEAARFLTALGAYEEAWGTDAESSSLQLHAKADTPLATAIGHAGARLTGAVRLAFTPVHGDASRHSGSIVIRSVSVGPAPTGDADTRPDALRLIALGAAEGESQRLTVRPTGSSTLTISSCSHEDLRRTFREFGEVVDAAIAAGPNAVPTPGWWCSGCAFVRNCPAVSATRTADLIEAYPA